MFATARARRHWVTRKNRFSPGKLQIKTLPLICSSRRCGCSSILFRNFGVEFEPSNLKHVRDLLVNQNAAPAAVGRGACTFVPVASIFNFLHIYVGDVPSWRHPARSYRGPSAAFEKVDKSYFFKRMPGSASLLRCCRINIAMAMHTSDRA